jgi:DNA-binding MarR family transcriptional regulator
VPKPKRATLLRRFDQPATRVAKPQPVSRREKNDPWLNPAADGGNLLVDNFPSYLLLEVLSKIHRNMTRFYLRPQKLGLPEWRVLAHLEQHSPTTASGFNARSTMDKGQISRVVAALVRRKLIGRTGDAEHGRRQILRITKAGQAVYRAVMPKAQLCQAVLLRALSRQERLILREALHKMEAASARTPV